MLFDIGHANVVADSEGVTVAALTKPVLDVVGLFHVHDNLGARRRGGGGFSFDPLRLDLHLPPGLGTLPWELVSKSLLEHEAPLMLEIHPSHRPAATSLREALRNVVLGDSFADIGALETVPSTIT
jgi:sugar phosphate isomerase/epimerase